MAPSKKLVVPANTVISLDDKDFWAALFDKTDSAFFWDAELAMEGEIPLREVTAADKDQYHAADIERPWRFMRRNVFVVEIKRGVGVNNSTYYLIYDGMLKYSLMHVGKDAVTTSEEVSKAKETGSLILRPLEDKKRFEYNRVGAFILYRCCGGKNGDPETVWPQRVTINPTRAKLEELGLWEALRNFAVDRVFQFDILDNDPTTQRI